MIIGGESGNHARPMHLEWAESLVEQCLAAGVPAFVKQLGAAWATESGAVHKKGSDPAEWPAELRVREFPT